MNAFFDAIDKLKHPLYFWNIWRKLAGSSLSDWRCSCDHQAMSSELTFDVWKSQLKQDCERLDKALAYTNLGDDCLRLLWEFGTEPSVQGVIEGCRK